MNKPKIALIADVPHWAFFNIAEQIKSHLSNYYDFTIFFSYKYHNDSCTFVSELFKTKIDIVHFFDRFFLNSLIPYVANASTSIRHNFINANITFSVYDHLLLSPSDRHTFNNVFNYISDGYTVSSEKLFTIYSGLSEYPRPEMIIEDTVDPELFYHENLDRFKDHDKPLIIGWAGNSKWMEELDAVDHKGLHTIIKPALAELQREGINIIGRFADSSEQHTPLEDMVHYYNSIDIYVCASDIEGTPNPVLEAMACGLPIISTDVGIVPQVFGPLQQEFILRERTVESLKTVIKQLASHPEKLSALSEENIKQMKTWTRDEESRKWDTFFKNILMQEKQLISQTPVIEKNTLLMTKKDLRRLCIDLLNNYSSPGVIEDYNALISSYSWKITGPLRRIFKFVRYLK